MGDIKRISDEELVQLCLQGSREGWAYLAKNFGKVAKMAIRQVFKRADDYKKHHEDVRGEFYLSLCDANYKTLKTYKPGNSLRAFLYTVAYRRAVDYMRRIMKDKARLAFLDNYEELSSELTTPLDEIQRRELKQFLEEEIASYRPDEAAALRMYAGNFKYREIAATLKMNQNTVATLISRRWDELEKKVKSRYNT